MTRSRRRSDHWCGLSKALRIIVAVLGCLHLCGGHYGVVQTLAWSKMLVDYSQRDGLVEGAIKTFDGKHPCPMCQQIGAAKKREAGERPNDKVAVSGLQLKECVTSLPINAAEPFFCEIEVFSPPGMVAFGMDFSVRPPVPPPRGWV